MGEREPTFSIVGTDGQELSCVRLDLSTDELFYLFDLLVKHGRKDLLRSFLTRLRVEEYLTRVGTDRLAARYGVEPIPYP